MQILAEVIDERLAKWGQRLKEQNASPVILVGIGHDRNSGNTVLCTVENEEMSIQVLRAFLVNAVELLDNLDK